MLVFENAVFLHVPKTGGQWVKAAVTNAGLAFEEYVFDGDVHGDLSCCPFRSRFVFAFVREPLSLYRSYWRYKMAAGWDDRNPFDMDCASPTFHGFVENVLRAEPAWCSRMFEDYVGVEGNEIDFVGRFETLAEDLIHALRMTGATFDEQAIRTTPAVNVSTTSDALAHWSVSLADRVRQSERAAITRFGYDDPEGMA